MKPLLHAHFIEVPTSLGTMTLASTSLGLAGAWFLDQRDPPSADERRTWRPGETEPVLAAAREWLNAYFLGQAPAWQGALDLSRGTAFQQAVWQALLEIPHGRTTRYGAIAERIGRPAAVRAAGAAIGANPISLIVPCHRVVGADGSLTGYAGGLPRKVALLELESPNRSLI